MPYASHSLPPSLALRAILAAAALAASITVAAAASCTASIDDMNFGAVDTLAGLSSEGSAQVAISCDGVTESATVVTVCGNLGAGSGGANGSIRRLVSGGNSLDYQLFGDSGRGASWGSFDDTTLGQPKTIQLSASSGTASGEVTLYGSVSAGQVGAATGSYLSTFTGAGAAFYYAEGSTLDCAAPATGTLTQASFSVTASVDANCLIEVEDIDFGLHGIIDSDVTASGSINVTCTPGTNYHVTMGGGLGGVADPEQRLMQSGSDTIIYGLYSDAAFTMPWGMDGGTQVTGTGAGSEQALPVYGRVAPQAAAPGQYSDTVVVTITYN
ncbi:spore coat protein U-like protein [Hoeflea marina]|uniref:Spore coat protein U-like protein n=1 Tax=Hoeflea marina TaxID=274592 RepID=A0A317PSE7_9HYPH|nr:spore coat protein U domain-containing protein [Hoeflea marina]PWW04401.1 spore coat protein U-like protein [Hoeflea marina]